MDIVILGAIAALVALYIFKQPVVGHKPALQPIKIEEKREHNKPRR